MSRYVVQAGWDDVPHLTAEVKADMLASIPPYQRDARSKGIPQLGSGVVYPVPESDVVVPDFAIPEFWPISYGLDVGWNWTALVQMARDPDAGIVYLYSAIKVSAMQPAEMARLILDKHSGRRVRGAIDPAASGRGQADGQQLIQMYRDLGLDIAPANNSVESGINEVWLRLIADRLKICKGMCAPLLSEYKTYRRDERGRIVKENDHCVDAMRYAVMTFLVDGAAMTTAPREMTDEDRAMWANVGREQHEKSRSPMNAGV